MGCGVWGGQRRLPYPGATALGRAVGTRRRPCLHWLWPVAPSGSSIQSTVFSVFLFRFVLCACRWSSSWQSRAASTTTGVTCMQVSVPAVGVAALQAESLCTRAGRATCHSQCSLWLRSALQPPSRGPCSVSTSSPADYVDWLATNPGGDVTFPAWRASRAAGRFQYTEVGARCGASRLRGQSRARAEHVCQFTQLAFAEGVASFRMNAPARHCFCRRTRRQTPSLRQRWQRWQQPRQQSFRRPHGAPP